MRPSGGTGQLSKPQCRKPRHSKRHKKAAAPARGHGPSVADLQDELKALKRELQQRTRELSESLQQQIATADVLKVISQSTFDLQTVLNTLVESAARLCEADSVGVMQPQGSKYHFAVYYGYSVSAGAIIPH